LSFPCAAPAEDVDERSAAAAAAEDEEDAGEGCVEEAKRCEEGRFPDAELASALDAADPTSDELLACAFADDANNPGM
jgi:hypothetical protein